MGFAVADQKNVMSWPGVQGIDSLTYTCSHGIQPGVAQIVTYPQQTVPRQYGDLLFGDGFRSVTLRGCRAGEIYGDLSAEGLTWTLHVYDRRWAWRNPFGGLGGVSGRYNRSDARGKLVPWSIRSPSELASLLLDELGETGYDVNLPAGLTKQFGADLDRYLRLGENYPTTIANPFFNWLYTPPAEALAQLVDYFGCRIVYQPFRDRFIVTPIGYGLAALPDYPGELIAPSLTSAAAPRAVALVGSPVRIQSRFRLEPVGEEWDGSIIPIDQLSYAPKGGPTEPRILAVSYDGDPAANPVPALNVVVTWGDHVVGASWNEEGTGAEALDAILEQLVDDPEFTAAFGVEISAGELVITPKDPQTDYTVPISTSWPGSFPDPAPEDVQGAFGANMRQDKREPGRTWKGTPPPHFRNVRGTDRLAKMEAVSKAQKTVFKYFRIMNVDPSTGDAPLSLPWYGPLKRIQQVTLQPTKPEQLVPQPRIAVGVDKGNVIGITDSGAVSGQGVLPEYYNGVSKDREATVTGSVWKRIGNVFWFKPPPGQPLDHNTKPTDRVFVPFTVSQSINGDQLVVFSDYVYRWEPVGKKAAFIGYPELTLETGCLVTDPDNDQVVCYTNVRELIGGTAPPEWHHHDDVQVSVVGKYRDVVDVSMDGTIRTQSLNELTGWDYAQGDKEQADAVSAFYLSGHARKYELTNAEQRNYIGIYPIDPDGAVQQVTWKLDKAGPTTIASRNSEHSTVVPPYPARRRAEILPPDRAAAATNLAESAAIEKLFPRGGGAVK